MSTVSRRYAKAVFALAAQDQSLDRTCTELERLAGLVHDPAVGPLLRSPLLTPTRRRELTQMLARELGLSDLLTRFLSVLSDHQRLSELPPIAENFQYFYDQALGRVRITIRSAHPLSATQEQEITAAFARVAAKQVLPTIVVDPALLGGVLVELEGKVYDGTVRAQLERLAKELGGTAVF